MIRVAPPPPITPEMRKLLRQKALHGIDVRYAVRFPFSTAVKLATACGLPLEIVRWINSNRHRPKFFIEGLTRKPWWPSNLYRSVRLKAHRPSRKAFEIATIEELRAYVQSMRLHKGKYGDSRRRGRYFVSDPGDHIFNRDIDPPKTNPHFPDGVVGVRFDEDFFVCAALPYRFREISISDLVSVLYTTIDLESCMFIPDSKSAELKAYFEDRYRQYIAWKLANGRHASTSYDRLEIEPDPEGYSAKFLNEDGKPVFIDLIRTAEVDIEIKRTSVEENAES